MIHTVTVTQTLGVHNEMALFGQFTERGIEVKLSDKNGKLHDVGNVIELFPMRDSFKVKVKLHKGSRFKEKDLDGTGFHPSNGVYFLTKKGS